MSPRGAIACAVICAAVAITAVVGLVTTRHHGPARSQRAAAPVTGSGATTSDAARSTAASGRFADLYALAWARRSLPRGATVLVDDAGARAVSAIGLHPVTPAKATAQNARFVLDTPAVRSAAGRYPAVASALHRSVTVARFTATDQAGRIAVGQILRAGATPLASAAAARVDADRQLLANPAVRTARSAVPVLQGGQLDLRAAAVVALLAAGGRVEIAAVPVEQAERAAGQPARVIDLRDGNTSAARQQLAALTGTYRPMQVSTDSDSTLRVTWPVDLTPVVTPR